MRDRHGATTHQVLPDLEGPTFARVLKPAAGTEPVNDDRIPVPAGKGRGSRHRRLPHLAMLYLRLPNDDNATIEALDPA